MALYSRHVAHDSTLGTISIILRVERVFKGAYAWGYYRIGLGFVPKNTWHYRGFYEG
jgi:hypothetical protein